MGGRQKLPRQLERDVLVEAGHRCAVPRCLAPHPEIHHIRPVGDGGNDDFENLIALCPNCHAMADRDEIDRKAVRQYKANLSVLNHRYSSMERRVLSYMAEGPDYIDLPPGFEVLLWYLIEDGYLTGPVSVRRTTGGRIARTWGCRLEQVLPSVPETFRYTLTAEGRGFIDAWLRADTIE